VKTVSIWWRGEASTNVHRPAASQSPMSHPKDCMFLRMPSGRSSKVTNTPGSDASLMPVARNWTANTVLPLPAVPETMVIPVRGSPP
jgi:hypothetical protein